MYVASADLTAFRFSTADVPPGSRLAVYRDVFRGQTASFDIEALDDEFSCDVTFRALAELRVNRIATSPVKVSWRRAGIADGITLVRFHEGTGNLSQCGREATVGAGDAIVLSGADPLSMQRSRSRYVYLSMPRAALAPMVPNLDAMMMLRIKGETDVMRFLAGHLDLLTRNTATMDPELARIAATHVQDLIALAVGATRDAEEIAKNRGLRAARLRALQADIMSSLGSGRLTVASLAARHRVTPRYVHKLFESDGTTFSRFVLGQRLVRVHRRLTDPRYHHLTIGALAYAAGFGDLSTFNREFRRQYGATPTDVRASARTAPPRTST